MGIDRIGPGGQPVPIPETGGAPQVASTGAPFRVEPARGASVDGAATATVAPAQVASVTRTPLQRLQAGEIDLGGYVDLKVDEATAHLSGLPPGQLASIRSELRDRMTNDPALVDLLRSAAGGALPAGSASND
jgi:hypothetical protein